MPQWKSHLAQRDHHEFAFSLVREGGRASLGRETAIVLVIRKKEDSRKVAPLNKSRTFRYSDSTSLSKTAGRITAARLHFLNKITARARANDRICMTNTSRARRRRERERERERETKREKGSCIVTFLGFHRERLAHATSVESRTSGA